MKNLQFDIMKTLKLLSLIGILFFVSIPELISQNDTIFKNDGQQMVGKVMEVSTDNINFVYKNETINYTVPKKEINKITFASGRVEMMNSQPTATNRISHTPRNTAEHKNKVAILPFEYIRNQDGGSNAMAQKIQNEAYSIFMKRKIDMKFQDPSTTNALLAKAGITGNIPASYTMIELCDILGVEFLVKGIVSVQKSGENSYSNTNVDAKKTDRKKNSGFFEEVLSGSSSTSSSTTESFATSINMNIYNDKGENIFNQDHSAFWNMEDSYKTTLNYLAKRTPIYKK